MVLHDTTRDYEDPHRGRLVSSKAKEESGSLSEYATQTKVIASIKIIDSIGIHPLHAVCINTNKIVEALPVFVLATSQTQRFGTVEGSDDVLAIFASIGWIS